MKKYKLSVCALLFAALFSSCDDFLQREPQDFGSEIYYFYDVKDMMLFNNTFYEQFPKMNDWWGGIYAEDNNSDNQTSHSPNSNFYQGDKFTPLLANSEWKFTVIRDINYFLDIISKRLAKNEITGTEEQINHFLGEAYFFRAYDYYRLLSTIGDVPILTQLLTDDYQELVKLSKRAPRNEVARFILKDLDMAAELMMDKAPQVGRLSKDAALTMKARVALYEGTWLKYHQGTALAPGNPKWPGSAMYPDFSFEGGSIESEYNYFFEQACEAAQIVADKRSLYEKYVDMFNRTSGIEKIDEVILARHYASGSVSHSATHYLSRTGGGTGLTRAYVENFLLTSGRPVYNPKGTEYKGDKEINLLIQNRDQRLATSIKNAGYVVEEEGEKQDTLVWYKPQIWTVGQQGNATGYELKKWISYENGQDISGGGTSATPILRAAEAYLVYLEAYYERNGALDGNCDRYWRALRTRAGIDPDYNITIQNTDLSRETDLATKSRNQYVDPTLYNIRRERRCEFLAEGLRYKDLKRWRALDHMINYNIEGFNLWESFYQYYDEDQIKPGTVSQRGMGNYLLPFKLNSATVYYNGYTYPKAHYLEPIPVSEIIATSENGNVATSTIYQNPGWPNRIAGPADYSYDLD